MIFILITGLFVFVGAFMFFNSKMAIDNTIKETAILHAQRVADSIDPALYAEFMENPTKNETYEEMRIALNDYREKIGAMYVYTLQVTDGDGLEIIVDGMPTAEEAVAVGEPTTATKFEDVEGALAGGTSSTDIVEDPEFGNYMSAFAPITDDSGTVIGIVGIDMGADIVSKISADVLESSLPILIAGALVVFALILSAVYYFLGRKLNPLTRINEATKSIAGGNLKEAKAHIAGLDVKTQDEIGVLNESVLKMVSTLEGMITGIQDSSASVRTQSGSLHETSAQVKEAAEQISATMEEMAAAIELQAGSAVDISEDMTGFSELIAKTAEQGRTAAESAAVINERTHKGTELMAHSRRNMDGIYEMVEGGVAKVRELETKTGEVTSLVSFISDVASQTNLLALNAAIEAARAGEAGKGFAVVADEVRKLAEQVSTSVQDINRIVSNVKLTSAEMAEFLENGLEDVVKGKDSLRDTGEAFGDISSEIGSMNGLIASMSDQLQHVLGKQDHMKAALSEIAAVSEENAAGIEQVTASSQQMNSLSYLTQDQVRELHEMSETLDRLNSQFTLK